MHRIYLILLVCLAQTLLLRAQPSGYKPDFNKSISFPSPNAASLGKFGLIPVSHTTGMANVSIPIWELKEGPITVPISLTYGSNGLRPAEDASWVGLGWALQGGGSITRIIRGFSDLEGSNPMNSLGGKRWDELGHLSFIDDITANRIAEQYYDGEPDLFVFNCGQYSGKFILYQNQIIPLPYNGLKITKNGDDFNIITPEGVVYAFTKREMSYVTSSGTFQIPNHISSWLLTSITSPDGNDVVEFLYTDAPEIIESPSNFALQHSYMSSAPPWGNNNLCGDQIFNITGSNYSSVTSWRLETIRSRTTEVRLVPQTSNRLDIRGNSKALAEIQVFFRGETTPVRKYKLTQSYFSGTSDINTSRLKLTSVQQYKSGSEFAEPYEFQYYNEDSAFPSKVGFGIDHWGYSNGAGDPASGLVPHIYEWQTYGNAYREPSLAARTGMLQKITYPTKGTTTFHYEQNQYQSNVGALVPGPGLRVGRLEDFDGTRTRVTKYSYDQALFFGQPNYTRSGSYGTCSAQTGVDYPSQCVIYVVTGENSSLFGSLTDFSLAYKKVIESVGENAELGSTEYTYESSNWYEMDRDLRLKQTIVRNRTGTTVKSTTNTYGAVQDHFFWAFRPVFVRSHAPCENGAQYDPDYPYLMSDYEIDHMYFIVSMWYPLQMTEETDYSIEGAPLVTRTTHFHYGSSPTHRFPTRIENNKSDGSTTIDFLKYPQDYNTSGAFGADPFYNGLKKMKELNVNSAVSEMQSLEKVASTELIVEAKMLLYKSFGDAKNIQLAEVHVMKSTQKQSLAQSSTTGSVLNYNHLPYVKRYAYDYNSAGKLTSRATNKSVESYLWGYNNSLPIAKAEYVSSATLSAAYQAVGNNLSMLRTHPSLAGSLLTTYTYDPLVGVRSITDPNGITKSFTYDGLGRLKLFLDNDNQIIRHYYYNYKLGFK
ncbi:RHS repeat domain-containing protein [Dawidia soli]|uniref:YD repeat-containing protein n=1 Tax=Dawidia soli TaxID=2782352 RepID=A0AAP2DDC1_9BACT|nr:hypothetical protein [Dawidia soli]MBT1690061.1 hypothetical protein [Dawidia soli]